MEICAKQSKDIWIGNSGLESLDQQKRFGGLGSPNQVLVRLRRKIWHDGVKFRFGIKV